MPRKAAAAPPPSLYDVHPGIAMTQKWVAELPEKTGRSLAEWLSLVRAEGPATETERRAWLKKEHGLGTNSAWWIAERAGGRGTEADTPEGYLRAAADWVEAMYAGPKAALRPLHDRLLQLGRALGPDVRVCPCQTIVPLYRNHVFAQIKPSTRTRLDFGLALGDTKAVGRLLDTGGRAKGDRITHRFALTSLDEIDDDVGRWLRTAYERDA
jgi:hypothetical protein